MPKRRVFYSFHYGNDVMRVQQVRNMGALEKNKSVSHNKWEEIKQGGAEAIKNWINENMENKSCLIVLVGEETADRKWVKYEIKHAWGRGMGVVGIYIHNLKCPVQGFSNKGINPFSNLELDGTSFSDIVKCYNPNRLKAYSVIENNLEDWVEVAIKIRNQFP